MAQRALADGHGGLTTTIAGLYVLGFVDLGRGRFDSASARLGESLAIAERFGELLRVSAPLWGLAELALLRGRPAEAVELTERGRLESDRVGDTAMLLPFAVTGTRARLKAGDPTAAQQWVDHLRASISKRPIPAAQHALDHADGLLLLSRGLAGKASGALRAAVAGWDERHRTWESTWGRLDLASALVRANRAPEATRVAQQAAQVATRLGSRPLAERADAFLRARRGRGPDTESWQPLTVREFEVARKIAEGMTNAELAEDLGISPKTASSHVEHILAKLGATRRAEIGAWVATVRRLPNNETPRPH
jgi:DNA-binding CsgD family transcriptional regulator